MPSDAVCGGGVPLSDVGVGGCAPLPPLTLAGPHGDRAVAVKHEGVETVLPGFAGTVGAGHVWLLGSPTIYAGDLGLSNGFWSQNIMLRQL